MRLKIRVLHPPSLFASEKGRAVRAWEHLATTEDSRKGQRIAQIKSEGKEALVSKLGDVRTNRHSRIRDAVVRFILLFFVPAFAFAQTGASQITPSTHEEADEVTVDGCLYGGQGNFNLVNAEDQFELRGDLSALNEYLGDEVQVRGKQEGYDHRLSIIVSGVTLAFKAPQVELSQTISDPGNWHFQTNKLYGIRFALPTVPENATGGGNVFPNFVAETGTIPLRRVANPERNLSQYRFCGRKLLAVSES